MKLHKNIKLLAWFNFFTDFKLYAPVAIIYFARVSGSYALGMSIFAITQLAAAIFEVPTGILSDYIGRRKTVIYGAISSVIFVIFYSFGSYWSLMFGAIFEGLARSFYSGNNQALLHDSLLEARQENEYHEYLGKTSSMFQIALASSAIAGSIIAQLSFALVMWISVIPQILALLISFQMVEPKVGKGESANIFIHTVEAIRFFLKNKKLRLLSIASVLGYSLGESAYQFRAAFVNTLWPLWAVGISNVLSNIGAGIGFFISGKIIRRFKELKVLIIGSIYNRLINIIALLFPTIGSPVLMSSTSFFFGLTGTAKGSLFQKEFTQEKRATMASLNSLAGSLAFSLAAPLLGFIADRIGPAKALLLIHLLMFSTVIIYWKLFKEENG